MPFMQILSFSLILRIRSTAIRKCLHLLYPTASLERRTQDSRVWSRNLLPAGRAGQPRASTQAKAPSRRSPRALGRTRWTPSRRGWRSAAILQPPGRLLARAWAPTRFPGLAPGSYGDPGRTDQPVLVTVTPLCIPVAFALAL